MCLSVLFALSTREKLIWENAFVSLKTIPCAADMMMNVGFIQCGNNVKTCHKNNNNACLRDMQIEHIVNTLSQAVLSSLIGTGMISV